MQVDLTDLILIDGAPLAFKHIKAFQKFVTFLSSFRHFRAHRAIENCQQQGEDTERNVLNFMHKTNQLHAAVYCRHTELAYLRNVADLVLKRFADINAIVDGMISIVFLCKFVTIRRVPDEDRALAFTCSTFAQGDHRHSNTPAIDGSHRRARHTLLSADNSL